MTDKLLAEITAVTRRAVIPSRFVSAGGIGDSRVMLEWNGFYWEKKLVSACDVGRALDTQRGHRPLSHKLKLPREPAPISAETYNNLFKQWAP